MSRLTDPVVTQLLTDLDEPADKQQERPIPGGLYHVPPGRDAEEAPQGRVEHLQRASQRGENPAIKRAVTGQLLCSPDLRRKRTESTSCRCGGCTQSPFAAPTCPVQRMHTDSSNSSQALPYLMLAQEEREPGQCRQQGCQLDEQGQSVHQLQELVLGQGPNLEVHHRLYLHHIR